jgi:hypothetical protein
MILFLLGLLAIPVVLYLLLWTDKMFGWCP